LPVIFQPVMASWRSRCLAYWLLATEQNQASFVCSAQTKQQTQMFSLRHTEG